jgi:hypothetical protein
MTRREKRARSNWFAIYLTGPLIQKLAHDSGLRGDDALSACISEAATLREFCEELDLAPRWEPR